MKRMSAWLPGAVVPCLAVALSSTAVSAAEPDVSNLTASSMTRTAPDPVCTAARQATREAGDCAITETSTASAAQKATTQQLAASKDLKSADGTSLQTAAAARTIWTRTWSQTQRGLYYVNWWEKHSGRIYFDKAGHVWSTTSTYGYKGSHICGQGGGIGYSVKVTHCYVEKRYDLSRPAISQWDYYQVHVVAKGIPIYASHHMHSNAYDSGTITFP